MAKDKALNKGLQNFLKLFAEGQKRRGEKKAYRNIITFCKNRAESPESLEEVIDYCNQKIKGKRVMTDCEYYNRYKKSR